MGEPWYPRLAVRLLRALDRLYHALPQEPDPGAAIALALEQLQAVDMAFDGPIAPGEGEAGSDRREVLLEALRKADQRRNPTGAPAPAPRRPGLEHMPGRAWAPRGAVDPHTAARPGPASLRGTPT